MATAHRLLVIAFCILRDGTAYRELGGDYFDLLRPERTRNRLVRRFQRLGLEVFLQPRAIPEDQLDAPRFLRNAAEGDPAYASNAKSPAFTMG